METACEWIVGAMVSAKIASNMVPAVTSFLITLDIVFASSQELNVGTAIEVLARQDQGRYHSCVGPNRSMITRVSNLLWILL
jgi:hypothetical protein